MVFIDPKNTVELSIIPTVLNIKKFYFFFGQRLMRSFRHELAAFLTLILSSLSHVILRLGMT